MNFAFEDISSGIGPCFPLAGGLSQFNANAGGTATTTAPTTLSTIQASSLSTFINKQLQYTPLVFRSNDKN
jgi:hypothetical protein